MHTLGLSLMPILGFIAGIGLGKFTQWMHEEDDRYLSVCSGHCYCYMLDGKRCCYCGAIPDWKEPVSELTISTTKNCSGSTFN